MQKYNPSKIEKKWREKWYKSNVFKAINGSKKKKFYLLDEFPYPSGDGLHVGHCRPYIALDVIARKRRMQGFNVLYPMGWDAFGLPTENYAIKKGVHPSLVTKKNTDNFKRQMKNLGLSFDWSREINTTDPKYYKWTQWIFVQLFEQGLAYKDKIAINWCPSCKIGLANEEVISGKCERCDTKIEKREKEQWMIKITKYADRLIEDLNLVDYQEQIKIQQRDWIGKSEGAEIDFSLTHFSEKIKVFTTRPDTLFGCTFLVLAPEHQIIAKIKSRIGNWQEVEKYIDEAKNKSDIERQETQEEKTGIEIKGVKAINPANKKEIPIFIADYVMASYGTGAIMAVPAHDERDLNFAFKFHLSLSHVIDPGSEYDLHEYHEIFAHDANKSEEENFLYNYDQIKKGEERMVAYTGHGKLINSNNFDGIDSEKAKWEIIKFVGGKKSVNYKLRDWVFSRQRYWGEPIPMIFCDKCGWQTVPEKDLPIELPKVKKYQPTNTGQSPLAAISKWINTKCPKCKGLAKRETDTMPNWAGSNWYFLRYCDPKNNKKLADEKILKYWLPVDWYNGGMEHTTLHLLYSRFIFKFLWDIRVVPKQVGSEPYKKRTSHGMVLGEGGIKMSKSKGNVINPDDVAKQYGADTLRVYEMFMGPFEQMIPWDSNGIIGCRRFLEKVYNMVKNGGNFKIRKKYGKESKRLIHGLNITIKKVGEDIDKMKFNTAISSLMTFVGSAYPLQNNEEVLSEENFQKFLIVLFPFAPHLVEELWQNLKFKGQCSQQNWPEADISFLRTEMVLFIVQVNGKVRDKMEFASGMNQKQVEEIALHTPKIKQWIGQNKIKKIIFIPNKLINIVV